MAKCRICPNAEYIKTNNAITHASSTKHLNNCAILRRKFSKINAPADSAPFVGEPSVLEETIDMEAYQDKCSAEIDFQGFIPLLFRRLFDTYFIYLHP